MGPSHINYDMSRQLIVPISMSFLAKAVALIRKSNLIGILFVAVADFYLTLWQNYKKY